MKTIADWKSKTHLNQLNDDDNDENNIRSASALSNGGSRYNGDSRLNNMHSGSNGRLFQPSTNGPNYVPESENSIKAEKYLDIVKDLKKKYTRSRTEVRMAKLTFIVIFFVFLYKKKHQCNTFIIFNFLFS